MSLAKRRSKPRCCTAAESSLTTTKLQFLLVTTEPCSESSVPSVSHKGFIQYRADSGSCLAACGLGDWTVAAALHDLVACTLSLLQGISGLRQAYVLHQSPGSS